MLAVSSINNIPEPSIYHLIVERRLIDEGEMISLAHQFPNVKYLELLFPLEESFFLRCFKTLFSLDENIGIRRFWPKLVYFRTPFTYFRSYWIYNHEKFQHWLIINTDYKFNSIPFNAICGDSMFSIWL